MIIPRKMWMNRYRKSIVENCTNSPNHSESGQSSPGVNLIVGTKTATVGHLPSGDIKTPPSFTSPQSDDHIPSTSYGTDTSGASIYNSPKSNSQLAIPLPPPLSFPGSALRASDLQSPRTPSSITSTPGVAAAMLGNFPTPEAFSGKPKKLSLSEYRARRKPGEETPKTETKKLNLNPLLTPASDGKEPETPLPQLSEHQTEKSTQDLHPPPPHVSE